MYRLVYTARVRPAKEREAYQRAKEFAQYVSIKYSPFSIDAYSEVFGDIATVHLCADFEELATYERAMAQGATDVEFEATERKLVEWIIEGTEHETLLRSL